MLKKCALIAALMLVIGPASARADWLFTPNIGIGFGGDTPSNDKPFFFSRESMQSKPASKVNAFGRMICTVPCPPSA